MPHDWMDDVRRALDTSEVIRAVRSAPDLRRTRPLTANEVRDLEQLGNQAEDWSRVRVEDGFDVRRVQQSHFHGDIVLGRFDGIVPVENGLALPTGIYRSTLADCVVGANALIRDVKLLLRYRVGAGALLWDCGRIVCSGRTRFGIGRTLPLGIETGGREVIVYPEITLPVADALTRAAGRRRGRGPCEQLIAAYVAQVESECGIIETGAVIRDTPRVSDTYVGPHARIDGATAIEACTLLSNADERTEVVAGACVRDSLLQWGCRAADLAIVERSVLMEHSQAARHAKVTSSVVGPCTTVAEGEVTCCLLGPLVGFHHQALLIAALWPEGRGNVSHGASVGSNHTSRAPDQECRLGEGVFLGLGVKAKYPLDLSRAPYSVIACGVNLPPQRVVFPFSLLNTAAERWTGVPPDWNQIIPAWVLHSNLYALQRSVGKFRQRNQARRHRFDFALFTPERIDGMRDACRRLQDVTTIKDVYTERDLPGLGKNYLEDSHRRQALFTYQFFIRYYGLRGLLDRVQAAVESSSDGDPMLLLAAPSVDPRWEHQRQLLVEELAVHDMGDALQRLLEMQEKVARDVERSRQKDDDRGRRIIEDYADVHMPAAQDPVVVQTWEETRQLQRQVQSLLERLAPMATAVTV